MHWQLKGLVQKSLSFAPGGRCLNDCLQRRFGELRHFERHIAGKVEDWKLSLRYLKDVEFDVRGKTVVEIGSGWQPSHPICFYLSGVKRVKTYDTVRHLDADLTFRMLAALEVHLDSIAEACGDPVEKVRQRHRELLRARDVHELLSRAQVDYNAPADARASRLAPGSVDLVYSNSVMEHVPKSKIRELMGESKRILRPGGLALHNVACNDHYSNVDRRISAVNYLRYSESQWAKWNNSLLYQNRLRAPEFAELAAAGGLEVIYAQTAVRSGTREALAAFKVAPEFRRFSPEELVITTVDFIAKKCG
jgi:SAM-dependent methyltransferase